MSFTEAISSVFHNYAKFDGRARRSEYWYWTLFVMIINAVLYGLTAVTTANSSSGGSSSGFSFVSVISMIWSLAILVPGLAVCWRRLHDIGKSGAYYFIILIPLVGPILIVVWFATDSQPGPNQYGPNPKEPQPTVYY